MSRRGVPRCWGLGVSLGEVSKLRLNGEGARTPHLLPILRRSGSHSNSAENGASPVICECRFSRLTQSSRLRPARDGSPARAASAGRAAGAGAATGGAGTEA
eukprot:scaffold16113_cov131-Isochrysis_galbana.AAC.1